MIKCGEMRIPGKSKISEHREMRSDCGSVNFTRVAGHWLRAGMVSRRPGRSVGCELLATAIILHHFHMGNVFRTHQMERLKIKVLYILKWTVQKKYP